MSDAALAAFAASLRAMSGRMADVAREAAPELERVIKTTAAAGTDPNGNPWPSKRDGGRALPNAANAISASANDNVVIVKLTGPYVYHHTSTGKDARRILPDSGAEMPDAIVNALDEARRRVFERIG